MPISSDIEDAIERRRDEFLNALFRLLRQPSISTQGVGVVECAELVRTVLEEHGIGGRVMPTAGLPVVYGERTAGEEESSSPNLPGFVERPGIGAVRRHASQRA
jgi:acetylornithine deacetylase/succinyl-diaminopimelate desuccinylase-like protein